MQKEIDDENDVVWDRVTCPWHGIRQNKYHPQAGQFLEFLGHTENCCPRPSGPCKNFQYDVGLKETLPAPGGIIYYHMPRYPFNVALVNAFGPLGRNVEGNW